MTSDRRDFTEYDLLHGADFSWMCRVNPTRFEEEQNMEACRASDGEQMYFRTTRDISSGEELRVWLPPSLEEHRGLQRISEDEDYQWICQHCKETFQYSRALSAHMAYGCRELGSTSRETTTDKEADSDDFVPNDDVRFEKKKSGQSKIAGNEYEGEGLMWRNAATEQGHVNEGKTQWYSPDDTSPRINRHSSAIFGHSRALSNPRLASLISSFSRPRMRKFANESQSLAEYHKQEFRKKFQGNEHYLRRHLYRENMERKCSTKYRRALVMKDDDEYTLEGGEDELHIKKEKDEFINCFREDYLLDQHNNNALLPSLPESEILRNGNKINTSKYNFQVENFPLNDSFNSYSNITSPTGSKMAFVTRRFPTSDNDESLHVNKEHLSRESTRECTCEHHDGSRDKSSTADEERNAIEENEENRVTRREELTQTVCPSNQLNQVGPTANFARFGSYFVYQRMQRDQNMTCRQRLQCHCCPSPSFHGSTVHNASRHHEPAFFVDPMYRYSTYPRMIPFFAHHATNLPQASPRNQGFTCEYCGKVYCRKYVLKIHMRTHTGFKPLRCKVCDKSFSDPSNMKKHVKLHETEDTVHKCRHCGRNFVRYRGLLNHIKSKHSEHLPL